MMTLNLMPYSFVSNAGFLLYVSETSPRYEVACESFYRGIIDKVRVCSIKSVEIRIPKSTLYSHGTKEEKPFFLNKREQNNSFVNSLTDIFGLCL